MKGIIQSFNILKLFAIIFALLGILLLIFAIDGVAIAITFFTKVLFFLSILCFGLAVLFWFLKKKVKIQITEK